MALSTDSFQYRFDGGLLVELLVCSNNLKSKPGGRE
jgi:hypothetical protein